MASKGGRPPVEAPSGQKITLSIRTTPETKSLLTAAAVRQGANLSEEAERRLLATLRDDEALLQAMVLAYGKANAELIHLIGDLLNTFAPKAEWSTDEWARYTMRHVISRMFLCLFEPETALTRYDPKPEDGRVDPEDDRGDVETAVEDRTDFRLHELGGDTAWARSKRERYFGELGPRLIAWHDAVEAHPYMKAKRANDTKPPQPNPEAVALVERSLRRIAEQATTREKVQKPARTRRPPGQKS